MNTFSRFSLFCVGVAFTSLGLSPFCVGTEARNYSPFAATSLLLWGKCNSQR